VEEPEQYEFSYPGSTEESNALMAEFGEDLEESVVVNEDENIAYYAGKKIASGEDLDELAGKIHEWMESSSYFPNVVIEGERGNQTIVNIVKKGALDNFEMEEVTGFDHSYSDIIGSKYSRMASLLSESSAPGGEGDDGSAYDLADGRNFTGVDEPTVASVVEEYLDGKAVSMASFEDFASFVEDAYGVPREVLADYEDAWFDDDRRTLIACIRDNAHKEIEG
jgi:hypothetical protein